MAGNVPRLGTDKAATASQAAPGAPRSGTREGALHPVTGMPVPMAGPDGRVLTQPARERDLTQRFWLDRTVDTQFNSAWLFLALLLVFAGFLLDSHALFAAALLLVLVSAGAWAWNQLSLFGLHYTRRFSERRAFLDETIKLTLEVRNQKFLPLTWLEILDTFPAHLPVDGKLLIPSPSNNLVEFRSFWTLGAFQRLTREFEIGCVVRGYHAFGPTTIGTGDGFGLFAKRATSDARERIIVYPRLYSAVELGLPAKNPFGERRAQGLFEDPLRTAGTRPWQPADTMRRIHWKATARQQELLSRVYEPSEEPQVLIFLNVATLPQHWQGNIPELQERTISVAASLAALCTDLRLPVGLVANGLLPESDQALRLLPGRSTGQLVRILELLAAVTGFAIRPIEEMLLQEAPRLPWGATLLVITAVAHDELLIALENLVHAGRQVVLFTLAEEPPAMLVPGMRIYHLPRLVEDLVAPVLIGAPTEPGPAVLRGVA
jgi:uncharacterized protein (DUF58 family)